MDLDLSGCEGVTVGQVLWATKRMPRLSLLDVSGCRKLTTDFANPALNPVVIPQPPGGIEPGPLFWLVLVSA